MFKLSRRGPEKAPAQNRNMWNSRFHQGDCWRSTVKAQPPPTAADADNLAATRIGRVDLVEESLCRDDISGLMKRRAERSFISRIGHWKTYA